MIYYEKIGQKLIRIPKYITAPKKLDTSIDRAVIWLKKLKQKYGLYENLGRGVVMKISDKYIDSSSYTDEMNKRRDKIINFDYWCGVYN